MTNHTRVDDAVENKIGFPIREGLRGGMREMCSAERGVAECSMFEFRSVACGVEAGKGMREFEITCITRGCDRADAKRAEIAEFEFVGNV